MSKRFLTKLAGAVGLGSAALLLSAPAAALAAPNGQATDYEASERNSISCANSEQTNELTVVNVIRDNTIEESDVTFEQATSVEATNDNQTQPNHVIVCINSVNVEVEED
ncbi:hypothetical protein [Micromonospora sp. NPDC049301]|uniref:hypothetical protein n=1 Tax=Micromonospora sp. NPDC049301 TaxID=3155723 RepID=UPI0034194554